MIVVFKQDLLDSYYGSKLQLTPDKAYITDGMSISTGQRGYIITNDDGQTEFYHITFFYSTEELRVRRLNKLLS